MANSHPQISLRLLSVAQKLDLDFRDILKNKNVLKCFSCFLLFNIIQVLLLIYSCLHHASETVSEMAVIFSFCGEMVRIPGRSQNSDFYVSPKNVIF